MRILVRFAILLAVALGCFVVSASAQTEHAFLGSKNCRKCHIKEAKSWEQTAMAKAFDDLRPGVKAAEKKAAGLDGDKDYTTDVTCLKCHVTGLGKEGGFTSEAATPELVGVGCEMCHGAGGTYSQDKYMSLKNKEYKLADIVAVGLVEKVSAEQCVVCHNSESPFFEGEFDFDAKKDEGTHEHFPLKYSH